MTGKKSNVKGVEAIEVDGKETKVDGKVIKVDGKVIEGKVIEVDGKVIKVDGKVIEVDGKVIIDDKVIREKRFVLLSLKEEWKKVEANLARRTDLTIAHLSIAIITIFIGTCLFFLAKYNTNKVLHITVSSLTGISGILTLIKSFMDKFKLSKNNATNLLEIKITKTDEPMPTLMEIDEDELMEYDIERHKNFESFLRRINYLIGLEKKFGIGFSVLISVYVIILAIISILISTNLIHSSWQYADEFLVISIIAIGIVWFIYVTLSYCIQLFERILNFRHDYLLVQILHWPILILFIPLAIYYRLMRRSYLIEKNDYEKYFGKYDTENDDVTFFGTEVEAKLVLNLVLKLLLRNKTEKFIEKYLEKDLETETKTDLETETDLEKDSEQNNDPHKEIKYDYYLCKKIKKYLVKNKMISKEETTKISVILAERLKVETGIKDEHIKNRKKKEGEKLTLIGGLEEVLQQSNVKKFIEGKKDEADSILKYFEKMTNETLISALEMALGDNEEEYKKHQTQNDDEIIKLAMKIIKNKSYSEYFVRNNVKYFSFKKIFSLNNRNFHDWCKKFICKDDNLIFKLEPIDLTEKHKYEIKRLLSGLDLDNDNDNDK
ncbi:hypothetical protein C1645_745057 [Glomus cerebriforme]|uniref:Uncharacterized protein n=1 Tax=Glomus cerebriforme TaxID=658196 RepID=A0A397S8S0_9GLOM|nr:hypothetical protein C1645_745057 [Glomus cerebriforme]